MAERTEERTRDTETEADGDFSVGVDATESLGGTTGATADQSSESTNSYFSLRALLFAFGAMVGGSVIASFIPLVPLAAALGVPTGAFIHGLVASERRYVENGVAGGLVSGLLAVSMLFTQLLTTSVATGSLNAFVVVGVAAAVGLVLSVVGHYFGRDLRDGLTKGL